MARKRHNNTKNANPAAVNGAASMDGAPSPASTGAMDSLLEKLRAAAPQARDQRDRRRRARLKDRHQIRVASGQAIPDLGELNKGEGEDDETEKKGLSLDGGDPTAERAEEMPAISEGEDVAERAASMLQGLRGDGEADGKPGSRDSSLRVRRRRESADDERRNRRRRRGPGSSTASGGTEDRDITPLSPTLEPESITEEATLLGPPTTLVSPPSPEGTQDKPVELSP